jgi:hypothetical protein
MTRMVLRFRVPLNMLIELLVSNANLYTVAFPDVAKFKIA